jgi:FKBP-type peptidyl-prolyl cis-trans isomerase
MKTFSPFLIIAGLLLISGCNEATKSDKNTEAAQSGELTLSTINEKHSYALGMMISERVLKQYGEIDYQFLLHGISAQNQGEKTLLTLAEADQVLKEYQKMINDEKFAEVKARGVEFLKANALVEGVTETSSGLQYQVITAADGPKPTASDTVSVHYRGTLIDGTEFDSSYSRGEPSTFPLNQVIPGWTEGVQLMNVGSKYKFVVPYELGYGERGAGQSIGPFETLVFEVELIEIQ